MSEKKAQMVELLNEVLTAELVAINQYFLHAEMCQHWGFEKLYKASRSHSIGEMKHAEELMERIFFLEGLPNMQRLGQIRCGESVPEQMQVDLELEREAIERLNRAISFAREINDNGTRVMLEKILVSEEEHFDWLDAQLNIIEKVGVANYIAQQI